MGKGWETQHVCVSSAKVETSSLVSVLVLSDFCQGLLEDIWMTASECVVCWLCGRDVCVCVSLHAGLHVCLYEGCEPSSLSMAALMSPPVAMRACRLASRLMKPMALSCSSWDWNRTSGVWVCRGGTDQTSGPLGELIRHLDHWGLIRHLDSSSAASRLIES